MACALAGCETKRDAARVVIDANIVDAQASHADADTLDAGDASDGDGGEDLDALFENGLSLLEAAGNIVHANVNDCVAMGERLEEYRSTRTDAVARVQALYDPGRSAERKALQSRYRARFRAAWANVRPGIIKCKDTPKVKRVIREVWGDDPDAGNGVVAPPP